MKFKILTMVCLSEVACLTEDEDVMQNLRDAFTDYQNRVFFDHVDPNVKICVHRFESLFADESVTLMDAWEIDGAIEALAIKDGVDLVEWENGNVGYVSYYNGHRDGFEVIVME